MSRIKAHVIVCNEWPDFVVIGDEKKAHDKMAELKAAYFNENKDQFDSDLNAYNRSCHWRVYTVDGECI